MCNKEWKDILQSSFQTLERIEKKMFRMRIKLPPKSSEYLAAVRWANHTETRTEPRSGGLHVDSTPQGGGVALSSNSRDVEAIKLVDEHVSTKYKDPRLVEDEFKDVPESLEYEGPPIWDDKIDDVVVEVDEVHKEKTPKFEEVLCDVVPMHANHILLDSRTDPFEEEGNDGVRSKLSVQSKMDLLTINAKLIMKEMSSKTKEVLSVLLLNFKRRCKETPTEGNLMNILQVDGPDCSHKD
ncbi:ribosomal RNA small subunit methyltransferase H [Striga asiatica]|uniref:Ribosomal RNA small subunit methyltransferase H n=1 Tax=Striga asiatica TaxID=4170 RepID=A0A5A7Q0Q2_STRAF|nr:ribosomal RNA small subunit methyltransferase H [Striga asiatica]